MSDLTRGSVEALFRSVLQTGKEETLQVAVDHIMRELTAEREKVAELETRIPLEEWSAMLGKVARLEKDAATARSDADMYVRAWQRELGPWMARKHHHIDACVIGTQRLRAELESRGPKTCCELPEYCTNETCAKQQADRLARCEARYATLAIEKERT